MKKSEKRYYKFDVQRNFQYETHDADGNLISDMTESEWREKVLADIVALSEHGVTEVLYAFHDKDINDDGTSKGLHVHYVATFKDAKTQTAAIKIFGASSVHNCTPCGSYCDSVRYLSHRSESAQNECKYPYPLEVVHGWRISEDGEKKELSLRDVLEAGARKTTKKARKEQKKVRDFCATSIMDGSAVVSDVRPYYTHDLQNVGLSPVDYLGDKRMLKDALQEWLDRVTEFYQSNLCPLTTIYISGGGGTGKTSLANAIANSYADIHGVHKVAAPGKSTTFDFVGNYHGERVSIFNELAPAFTVEQFLSVFDPLNAMLVNSRHFDKLYFANLAIFTTSVSVEPFIYSLWKPYAKETSLVPNNVRRNLIVSNAPEADWLRAYLRFLPSGDDKILQIRRRIPIQITIDSGQAVISVLDKNYNSPDSFAFYAPKVGYEPYRYFRTLPYNVLDLENIDSQTGAVVQAVREAVDYYYKLNGFKHPDDFPKPDFDTKEDETK